MRFWDTSALVPLLVEEATSSFCRDRLREDPHVAVWMFTRTEINSALRRRQRAGELAASDTRLVLERLSYLEDSWTEVSAVVPVRDRADRLLAVHPLRAADALQLAAALLLVQERPKGFGFITGHDRLATAADAEGFDLVRLP